jgi:DNA-binding MarR family transcriptional regulator
MHSIEAMREIGLITTTAPVEDQADGQLQLTSAGQETVATVASACHDSLAELLDGWSPEQEAELASLLRRVTTTLFSEEHKKELISTPA